MPMTKQKKTVNQIVAAHLAQMKGEKWGSQEELAAKAGVSQKTISNCLNPEQRAEGATGRVPSVTLAALERICTALEAEVWELVAPFGAEETALLSAYREADPVGREVILRAAGLSPDRLDLAERALKANIGEATPRRKQLKKGNH